MSIQCFWLLENRIICRVMPHRCHMQDLQQADLHLTNYFDKSPFDTVHMIVDYRNLIELPTAQCLSRQMWLRNPKLGWVLIFGNTKPENEAKAVIAVNAVSRKIRHFDTLTETLIYLQSMDKTLPNLSNLRA